MLSTAQQALNRGQAASTDLAEPLRTALAQRMSIAAQVEYKGVLWPDEC